MLANSRIKNTIIGKKLQEKREILKLSRSDVAKTLGVKPQFVANWERGQCLPPKKVIPQLMTLFNMNAADIVNLFTRATRLALEEYFKELEIDNRAL